MPGRFVLSVTRFASAPPNVTDGPDSAGGNPRQDVRRSTVTKEVILVLLLALTLRAGGALGLHAYLHGKRQFLIPGDAHGYWLLGQKLAAGEEYSIYDPPRRVMRMPGFPLFLAGCVRVFGPSLLWPRLLLAGMGVVACGFVIWLGQLLVDHRTGLLAGLLAAISPTLTGFSAVILSETMFAACLVGSLVLLTRLAMAWTQADDRPIQRRVAFAAGLAIAAACYVRPSWLLVAPLFGVAHVVAALWRSPPGFTLKRSMIESACVMLGLALLLAPWTIRNYSVTGHAIPTTLWVGPSLYDGFNPEANGDSNMEFFERDRLLNSMSEYDMDDEYRRRAGQFIADNPGRAVTLGFAKLTRYWSLWPNAAQFQAWWMKLTIGGFTLAMFVCAAVGTWKLRRDVRLLLLTLGPVIYFAAIHSVFVGSLRYRLPAEYPLLILTAVGLLTLWDRFRPSAQPPAEIA